MDQPMARQLVEPPPKTKSEVCFDASDFIELPHRNSCSTCHLKGGEYSDYTSTKGPYSDASMCSTKCCQSGKSLQEPAKGSAADLRQSSLATPFHPGKMARTPSVDLHRVRIRRFAVNPVWMALQLGVVIMDLSMSEFQCRYAQAMVFMVFYVDIALRLYAFGPRNFFKKTLNTFDVVVVTISALAHWFQIGRYCVLGRSIRILRGLRLIFRSYLVVDRCCTCMRYIIGKRKARFVDPVNDIDLDLVYITQRIICMSVPAYGWVASLYRNPYSEVVHFFEKYHQHHYKIFNVCPEMPYPTAGFVTGSVECYDVQDHMPPTVEQVLDFLAQARDFLARDPENVVAVHCRGGKGRTGTFVAAWLMYDEECTPHIKDAAAACEHFARARTDLDPSTGDLCDKWQGIETPSQRRMVSNIHQLLSAQEPCWPHPVAPPPSAPVRLKGLQALGVFKQRSPPAMVVMVQVGHRVVYCSDEQVEEAERGAPGLRVRWCLDVVVDGSVRVSVARKSPKKGDQCAEWGERRAVAGKEPRCLFYVVEHTAFLGQDGGADGGAGGDCEAGAGGGGGLQLHSYPLRQVDKAHKSKGRYNMEGSLQLHYEPLRV